MAICSRTGLICSPIHTDGRASSRRAFRSFLDSLQGTSIERHTSPEKIAVVQFFHRFGHIRLASRFWQIQGLRNSASDLVQPPPTLETLICRQDDHILPLASQLRTTRRQRISRPFSSGGQLSRPMGTMNSINATHPRYPFARSGEGPKFQGQGEPWGRLCRPGSTSGAGGPSDALFAPERIPAEATMQVLSGECSALFDYGRRTGPISSPVAVPLVNKAQWTHSTSCTRAGLGEAGPAHFAFRAGEVSLGHHFTLLIDSPFEIPAQSFVIFSDQWSKRNL
jgi:hypothetical protein